MSSIPLRTLGALVTAVLVSSLGALPANAAPVGGTVAPSTTVSLTSASSLATMTAARTRRVSRSAPVRERAVRVAAAQQGDPYRYGATGPNAFDCSGLTSFAYKRVGKALPRTSSMQRSATKRIRAGQARRGDLVFFHGSSGVYHVGLYAGRGRIWHAPQPGTRVHRAKIWTRSVSYGRVRG